jgi:hypothetical protein
MQRLQVHADRVLCAESCDALRAFLGGIAGVAAVALEGAHISIAYDERKVPAEQLLAMTRSSAELLGYHVSFLS